MGTFLTPFFRLRSVAGGQSSDARKPEKFFHERFPFSDSTKDFVIGLEKISSRTAKVFLVLRRKIHPEGKFSADAEKNFGILPKIFPSPEKYFFSKNIFTKLFLNRTYKTFRKGYKFFSSGSKKFLATLKFENIFRGKLSKFFKTLDSTKNFFNPKILF